jgi:uncharacterized membrane protein YphA (DoxX/SURF4 family)
MILHVPKMRARAFAYWMTTGLVATVFLASGVGNVMHVQHIVQDMAHLGYPPYFHMIIGTWKVLGAVTIIVPRTPRLKEWAYAGMMFDLTGAAASRFSSGDAALTIIIPLLISIAVILSWAFRPSERTL